MRNEVVISVLFMICVATTGCKKEEVVEHPFSKFQGQYQWLYTYHSHSNSNPYYGGSTNYYGIIAPQQASETRTIIIQPDGTFQLFMGDSLAYEDADYNYYGSEIELFLDHPYFPYTLQGWCPFYFYGDPITIGRESSSGSNHDYDTYIEYWKRIQ